MAARNFQETSNPVSTPRAVKWAGAALALGLCIAICMPTSEASATNESGTNINLSEFDGHWQRIEDEDANQARLSSIGKALKELSWIMRKFASPILRKTTAPPKELKFVWDGNQLREGLINRDGNFSRLVDPGGEPHFGKDYRGVDFSSVWAFHESGLQLRWQQHQATGSNVYRIDSQEHTLVVEHTINVTAISNVQPIVFQTRFRRTTPTSLSLPAPQSTSQNYSDPILRD